ncbi:MAG: SsrA-binding protein SmpB [Bacteroidota bacterium]
MAKKKKQEKRNYAPTISNRKARYEFKFVDTFEAGIVLSGTEIKSIRLGKANIAESYCYFRGDELFIKDMHINPYEFGSINNLDPTRDRKLLLSRKELDKLRAKSEEKGLTIIVTKLYFNKRNICKLQIALAQGKKLYDKREDIKSRDIKRVIDRELRL